jgi:hypothetical protein
VARVLLTSSHVTFAGMLPRARSSRHAWALALGLVLIASSSRAAPPAAPVPAKVGGGSTSLIGFAQNMADDLAPNFKSSTAQKLRNSAIVATGGLVGTGAAEVFGRGHPLEMIGFLAATAISTGVPIARIWAPKLTEKMTRSVGGLLLTKQRKLLRDKAQSQADRLRTKVDELPLAQRRGLQANVDALDDAVSKLNHFSMNYKDHVKAAARAKHTLEEMVRISTVPSPM